MGWRNQKCSWVRLEKAIEMQVSRAAGAAQDGARGEHAAAAGSANF